MDIGLFVTNDSIFDFRLTRSDLDPGRDLETAAIISLFTDRRAADDDPLPDAGGRRGFWGDTFPVKPGDRIGSRLWLLHREKRTPQTLARAREYAREALAWMVEDGVAEQVETLVAYDKYRLDIMLVQVDIYRPTGKESLKFDYAWMQFGMTTAREALELELASMPYDALLTEGGDALVTESGDRLIL
jgi:phage gp46-like protein